MNVKTLFIPTAISAALCLGLAAPSAQAQEPSFSYIGGSYIELDEADTTFDGYEAEISSQLGERWFLSASYAQLSGDWTGGEELDLDVGYARLGFIVGDAENAAFYLGPQAQYLKADFGFGSDGEFDIASESETDYGAFGGVKVMLGDRIELNGEASWVDMEDENFTSYSAGVKFFITKNFAATGEAQFGDLDGFKVGLSYHF
ncbi:Outer membrane protein beta-barrel domain-containing protein [Pseudidiomarina planktonica]|uniref:Outer membrane protein beta-barrel domain-containing protein n=1 Tax=Pseudidiomarina planktonica TaxID=1323738 RepID=A0A1Y6E7A3_9GAMM|nr:outer membrane beta-barrel protein [Pseudidiomarina planktonica]SMQ58577.1 Outer membrane protein beta-barrel domain-containing protein [Pseudidiomarina planktonica]